MKKPEVILNPNNIKPRIMTPGPQNCHFQVHPWDSDLGEKPGVYKADIHEIPETYSLTYVTNEVVSTILNNLLIEGCRGTAVRQMIKEIKGEEEKSNSEY